MKYLNTVILAVIAVLLGTILWSMPRMDECATCGAHVIETWHTQDKDGNLVHICRHCADLADE